MQFRPLLWPTLFALPALLVLLWLGTWQVQRLEWKNQLIEDFESRATAAPVDLPSGDVGPEMEFRRLALTGSYDHDREVFMTGRTYEGNAGFHIVTPFTLTDGRTVLINRGWVSESYREQNKREFTLVEGEVTVAAILRFPGKRGYFVPRTSRKTGSGSPSCRSRSSVIWGFRGKRRQPSTRPRCAHPIPSSFLLRHAPKPTFATRILDMPSPGMASPAR